MTKSKASLSYGTSRQSPTVKQVVSTTFWTMARSWVRRGVLLRARSGRRIGHGRTPLRMGGGGRGGGNDGLGHNRGRGFWGLIWGGISV